MKTYIRTDKKVMSWYGKQIWKNEYGYMVAKGDGTDEYFGTIEQAMKYCEDHPRKIPGRG
jgi:hypothetical protein